MPPLTLSHQRDTSPIACSFSAGVHHPATPPATNSTTNPARATRAYVIGRYGRRTVRYYVVPVISDLRTVSVPVRVRVAVAVIVAVIVIGTATHAASLLATGAFHDLTGVGFEAILIRIGVLHKGCAATGRTECNVIVPGSPQCALIHGHPTHGVK